MKTILHIFTFCLWFGTISIGVAMPETPYYWAIQNLAVLPFSSNAGIVQRGSFTGDKGIPEGNVILAPNTHYRYWLMNSGQNIEGYIDFKTPGSGQSFEIPPTPLRPPASPDLDGDGLSGDAEMILNTDPLKADTDGDGIGDGAALRLGLNPSVGGITGTISTTMFPGIATDVAAFDDLALVAAGDAGVAIFNIFNVMQPMLLTQVDTPGSAVAVSVSGAFAAVADGIAGLSVISLTNPANISVTHQIQIPSGVYSVATAGNFAFAASGDQIFTIFLPAGVNLASHKCNGVIEDLCVSGSKLFVLTEASLQIFEINDFSLDLVGRVTTSGSPSPSERGRVLFVGGSNAFIGSNIGLESFNVSDPYNPYRTGFMSAGQNSLFLHNLAMNGTGLLVAITSFLGPDTLGVSLYDISDSTSVTNFITSYDTPGHSRAVTIYNGQAYVADGTNGLATVNYLAVDRKGIPPSVQLRFGLQTNVVEAGKAIYFEASVQDDVQVRNVEFYNDGVKIATDGNYPFEYHLTAPRSQNSSPLRIRARVSDTGGNSSWSEEVMISVTPDTTPPQLQFGFPRTLLATNSFDIFFSESITSDTVTSETIQIISVGNDGILGNEDDIIIDGLDMVYDDSLRRVRLQLSQVLLPGAYTIVIYPNISDLAGNRLEKQHEISIAVINDDHISIQYSHIAVGDWHSAAIARDGSLWTWGLNTSGRLGHRDDDNRYQPTRIPGTNTWLSVACNMSLTLAIRSDNTLWSAGNIGPNPGFSLVLPNERWKSVATSSDCVAAINLDGSLWTWGSSSWLLGDNSSTTRNVPSRISNNNDWVSIFGVSWGGFVAMNRVGSFWGWGNNSRGELLPNGSNSINVITELNLPKGILDIAGLWASGENGSSLWAIASDGTLWKQNSSGFNQWGLDSNWTSLSGYGGSLIARRSDGSLWGLGDNESGQLDGRPSARTDGEFRRIDSYFGWSEVVVSSRHSLGVRDDGSMWCWGSNTYGQRGDSIPSSVIEPFNVMSTNIFKMADAGPGYTIAIDQSGKLWTWGINSYGQLGIGNRNSVSIPVSVRSDLNWKFVSAGVDFVYAIEDNGRLWGWGKNFRNRFGSSITNAIQDVPIYIDTGSQLWNNVAAGRIYSAGIGESGELLYWQDISDFNKLPGSFSMVEAGYEVALAIHNNGSLWQWGSDDSMFLDIDGSNWWSEIPTPMFGGDWNNVAIGSEIAGGIHNNSQFWVWGKLENLFWWEPVDYIAIYNELQIIDISIGSVDGMAIDSNGRLWAFGHNYYDELQRIGEHEDWNRVRLNRFAEVNYFGDDIPESNHSVLLKIDGSLWTFGEGDNGQLGNGYPMEMRHIGPGIQW